MKKNITWKNKSAKKEYLNSLSENGKVDAVSYNKSINHEVGDYIKHFKFGFGFIQKVISHTKVEVFFEDSEKVLLQNWQES